MHTFNLGGCCIMARKTFSPETKAKAVRLARLRVEGDDRSNTARYAEVAKQFGVTTETVARWVRQAEIDEGLREGVPTATAEEITALRARNAELEQTIEILKAAAVFFAREYDPRPIRSADSSPNTPNGSESYRSAER
jgi:transposase-like protein